MDEQSEIIKSINGSDERAGSREIVYSDENDSNFENDIDTKNDVARISLEFIDGDAEKYHQYPNSYYTFSARERLLLIFAENFRRRFIHSYPERKPLVLAVPNECDIQKFVSTSIRPTSFLYHEFIDCWTGPAQFVADFITYELLQNPLEFVSKTQQFQFLFGKDFIKFIFISICIYTFIT